MKFMEINTYLSSTAEKQVELFFNLSSARDVAFLLEIPYKRLAFHLYQTRDEDKYEIFHVKKRGGGERIIYAPSTAIKLIQRKLNDVLQNVYHIKPPVHAYVRSRSILTNAKIHANKRWVFNIDLKDFFPSINFGRVRGMFHANPYNLPLEVATVLAQICCAYNLLPQGAPTSPIVSNMLCGKLDSQLTQLAKINRCFYSRYADDITFSTSLKMFPTPISKFIAISKAEVGDELENIIVQNGFVINRDKVRLQPKYRRQEVTGLVVNEFPNIKRTYIKEVRAMLHSWEVRGIDEAHIYHYENYENRKTRNPDLEQPDFRKILKGKIQFIGMVRGKKDKIFKSMIEKYYALASQESGVKIPTSTDLVSKPIIFTEGKTDALILKNAWAKLFPGAYLPFIIRDCDPLGGKDGGAGGAGALKDKIKIVDVTNPHFEIAIFDRDVEGKKEFNNLPKTWKILSAERKDIKISDTHKGAAFLLPIPESRELYADSENLCIEFLFNDDVLEKQNENGDSLEFEYPRVALVYGGRSRIQEETRISRDDMRIIKNGKKMFSTDIVPTLEANDFENFRQVFIIILELIDELIQRNK